MNNKNAEWQHEFYLTHDKYRMQRQGTDCYKVVKDLTRILQLPTIAKLTTDNESVISDFRLNSGEYGLEPYDEYAIKVDDTYGASFYILVHRRADTTFLCPILVGFEGENTCAMVMPTDNWRMREMTAFVELRRAEKEFGVDGLMMAVNTRNGVYGCLSVLNESGNLLERWLRTERDSLHERNSVTAPSSAALILQIWLHTICLWKRRCLSRKVEQRIVHADGEQETVGNVRECLNTSKQTIVDLKKGIVVYVNDGGGKRAFAGYCVLQSERCGHFRHLQSGRVVYLKCQECEDKICEKDWFFCGVAGTPLSMTKSRKQMSECIDKMLAKREKVVIAAESGKKMTALAAMYASERGYSFIPVTNDDLPTYLSKQQQKGCVVFEGVADEREIESAYRKLRIPLRHCRLEGA